MKNFEFELNLHNQKNLSRWNIFFFTFLVVFVITILQYLGLNLKNININGSSHTKPPVLNNVLPNLEKIPNNYKVKEPTSLIQSSYASSSFDFDNASSYIAVDFQTGDVIAEKNPSQSLPIASLTKIMTAVVALDLAKPNSQIIISQKAQEETPTKIGVVKNQKMTLEELLNAMLLTSANDAAQAVKDGIDNIYPEPVFIGAMNKKASMLGLTNTSFSNPQGFDSKNNYSSTKDLVILSRYALTNYPLIAKIVSKDYQFISANKNHKQFDLYNWNSLLGVYPGVTGVKIGDTDEAGNTMVVVSQRGDKKILVALLGAPGILERDLWTSDLLDFAFQKSANLPPVQITEKELRSKYSTWKYWN